MPSFHEIIVLMKTGNPKDSSANRKELLRIKLMPFISPRNLDMMPNVIHERTHKTHRGNLSQPTNQTSIPLSCHCTPEHLLQFSQFHVL